MNPLRIAICILVTAPCGAAAQEPVVLKHEGWVAAIAFSSDGKAFASGGADKILRLWEVATWKQIEAFKGHTDIVSALTFSRRGLVNVISGSFDGKVKGLGDVSPKALKLQSAVTCVHFVAGAWFVTGSLDGKVRLCNEDLNPTLNPTELYAHKSWVNGLAVHEKTVASASSDGTVGLNLHEPSGKLVFLEGGAGEVRSVSFSPNGKLLAAGNRFGTVRVWNVASLKEVKTLTGHMGEVWSVAFSPDGKTLAAVDTEWKKPSKIKLYDTTTWQVRDSLPCPGEILCIAYSPKGDWLAAGCWDKTVRVFSLKR